MSYWSQLWLPDLKSRNVTEVTFMEKLVVLLMVEMLVLGYVITHLSLTSIKPYRALMWLSLGLITHIRALTKKGIAYLGA